MATPGNILNGIGRNISYKSTIPWRNKNARKVSPWQNETRQTGGKHVCGVCHVLGKAKTWQYILYVVCEVARKSISWGQRQSCNTAIQDAMHAATPPYKMQCTLQRRHTGYNARCSDYRASTRLRQVLIRVHRKLIMWKLLMRCSHNTTQWHTNSRASHINPHNTTYQHLQHTPTLSALLIDPPNTTYTNIYNTH